MDDHARRMMEPEFDRERFIRALRLTTVQALLEGAKEAHPDDDEAQAEWIANEMQRLYDIAGSAN
jgi:hypothetical protein